jgi:GNAT superfamily N-acetyltransferase
MTLREATTDDLDVLVDMGMRFARETVYARTPINADVIRKLGGWLIDNGVIYVAVKDEQPVGMVGVTVLPHMMTGRLYGAEVFWWCNPEARGHGLRLLRAAEQWAKAHGAETMQFVAPSPEVETLYQKLDYAKIETAYEKDLICLPASAQPC